MILAHFLSRRRERHARFAAAALAFRSAFSAELAALEPNVEGPKSVEDFLRSAYEKHRSAVIIFRDFLPDKQRANFDADWQKYHSGQEIDGEPVDLSDISFEGTKGLFLEYSPWPGGFQRRDTNPKTLAAERIDKLLSYARHT